MQRSREGTNPTKRLRDLSSPDSCADFAVGRFVAGRRGRRLSEVLIIGPEPSDVPEFLVVERSWLVDQARTFRTTSPSLTVGRSGRP